MNARFAATLYGILAVLYVNDSDRIIRRQLALMETYSGETDPVRKAAAFVQGVGGFPGARAQEERKSRSPSETVKLFLASCSPAFKELRPDRPDGGREVRLQHQLPLQPVPAGAGPDPAGSPPEREAQPGLLLALKDGGPADREGTSWNLGFIDAAYFSQLFKTRFGLLPPRSGSAAGIRRPPSSPPCSSC